MVAGEGSVRPWESHRGDGRLADKGKLKGITQVEAKTRRAQMSRAAEQVRALTKAVPGKPSSSSGG